MDIFSRAPDKFPTSKYTLELFLWAFVMLFSRAARLSSKANGEELALVPYADLMNHNPYSNTYIDAQKSGLPLVSRTEEVAIYADRSYKKFEQVRSQAVTHFAHSVQHLLRRLYIGDSNLSPVLVSCLHPLLRLLILPLHEMRCSMLGALFCSSPPD